MFNLQQSFHGVVTADSQELPFLTGLVNNGREGGISTFRNIQGGSGFHVRLIVQSRELSGFLTFKIQ